MSVQLTIEQETELAHLAQSSDRTTDELAQEAVARFLCAREIHKEKIEKSRAQIASGNTKSNEEVFTTLKRRKGWE